MMTITTLTTPRKTISKPCFLLSARERQVLQLAAAGWTNKEIAGQLQLSCDTIDKHNRNVVGKMEAKNMKNAIALAFKNQLIQ